ncbi:MAG: Trp family transcriptional regulator [Treponema sp.]|nr:trp operon repressor [Spirochaetia bacterium]MDY2840968.1 Trp family transcriptional regulator [Treponema sp.]
MNNNAEITDEAVDETLQELCHLIYKMGNEEALLEFFNCLFTPPERKDFASRWLLVKEIDKGTTQRDIAKKFGMSLCKITRGSKELKKEDSAFRKMLELYKSESQKS